MQKKGSCYSTEYRKMVHLFHIMIIAPLFMYTAYFVNMESKSLYISLVLYSGLFAFLYHISSFILKLFDNSHRENNDSVSIEWSKKVHLFHVLISFVFMWMGYNYYYYNQISDSLLGTVGGFGIVALIYHAYNLYKQI